MFKTVLSGSSAQFHSVQRKAGFLKSSLLLTAASFLKHLVTMVVVNGYRTLLNFMGKMPASIEERGLDFDKAKYFIPWLKIFTLKGCTLLSKNRNSTIL